MTTRPRSRRASACAGCWAGCSRPKPSARSRPSMPSPRTKRRTRLNARVKRPCRTRAPECVVLQEPPRQPRTRSAVMMRASSGPRGLTVVLATLALLCAAALPAVAAEMAATVHKPKAEVRQAPDFSAPKVADLRRGDSVSVSAQEGLWFKVALADGASGYLRVTDVRMDYAAQESGDANVRALFTGQAGKGRVTETAGVRGLDESALQSAAFDAGQLQAMEANRVDAATAAAHARSQGWEATRFEYAAEATTGKRGGATQASKRKGFGLARSLLGSLTGNTLGNAGDAALDVADASIGKSE